MPTGYTSKLYDGKPQTFEEFVLECARAFAFWTRDDNSEGLPDPPEQTFNQRWLAEAQDELARLKTLSPEQILAEHETEYWKIRKANTEYTSRNAQLKARYEARLREVILWEPPTEDHQGLKNFMIEQLQSSIQFDCGEFTYSITTQPFKWHAERIATYEQRVERALETAAEEKERNEHNKRWTAALRASLESDSDRIAQMEQDALRRIEDRADAILAESYERIP